MKFTFWIVARSFSAVHLPHWKLMPRSNSATSDSADETRQSYMLHRSSRVNVILSMRRILVLQHKRWILRRLPCAKRVCERSPWVPPHDDMQRLLGSI